MDVLHHADVRVITDSRVASDSPDHIQPWGTARDNSLDRGFNRKLRAWIPKRELRVLDLGCSGGGFVRSIIDDGSFAIGIEGSDYSQKAGRAEWAVIPHRLFTADITEPFIVAINSPNSDSEPLKFNLITAWEVMEHIPESKIQGVLDNIFVHLVKDGVVIMSISPNEELINGVRLHQSVHPEEWWVALFERSGFKVHNQPRQYFDGDWVRSEENAPGSFHLVMTRRDERLPHTIRLFAVQTATLPWRVGRRVAEEAKKILRSLLARRWLRNKPRLDP